MYSIRFHLGRGKNFMHFQVREAVSDSKQGQVVTYVDPTKHSLIFKGCKLFNKTNVAKKINEGKTDKYPCAWVLCEEFEVVDIQNDLETKTPVVYNPKVNPNWVVNNSNADGMQINQIVTSANKLYIKNK